MSHDPRTTIQFPPHIQSKLDRHGITAYREKGSFIGRRSWVEGKSTQVSDMSWTVRSSDGQVTTQSVYVGTLDVRNLGGSGNGYLLFFRDTDLEVRTPFALYSSEAGAFMVETDNHLVKCFADFFSGDSSGRKRNSLSPGGMIGMGFTLAIFTCGLSLLLVPIGLVRLLLGRLFSKNDPSANRRTMPVSEMAALMRDISVYLRDSNLLENSWNKESVSRFADPRL